jgi:hypothetical protein
MVAASFISDSFEGSHRNLWFEFLGKIRGESCDYVHFDGCWADVDACFITCLQLLLYQ